jgi:hypothetical protein
VLIGAKEQARVNRFFSGGVLSLSLISGCAAPHTESQPGPLAPAAEPARPAEVPSSTAEKFESSEAKRDAVSKSADDDRLATLPDAERALERARAELDAALLVPAPAPSAGAAPASAPQQDKDERREAPHASRKAASPPPPPTCEIGCRAFASLKRAASAICRLDEADGARCNHAKRVVSDAERHVASCACREPDR